MKYNEGDKVRIKSKEWYNNNKDEYGNVHLTNKYGWMFTERDSRFCGKVVTILLKGTTSYAIIEDDCEGFWTDEMIEGLMEEEVFIKANDIYNEEYSKGEYCHEQSFKWGFQEGYNYSHENDKLEISLKEGYQFKDENGNIINATKIVLEKKKKEYPKTYEECCEVLDFCGDYFLTTYDADCMVKKEVYGILQQVNSLTRLLICKSVYWKIAGEEMGLGKPWEPDWTDLDQLKYCIWVDVGEFITMTNVRGQHILSFPTEEMRDAFYENFKELINKCKELL